MSDTTSFTFTDSRPAPPPRSLAWLVGIVVGTLLAVILAVQLPDRAKLLGLFPIIWGGLVGCGYGWWASECRVALTPWRSVIACLLLAAGEAGIVFQAWQFYQLDLRQQFTRDPSAGFAKQAESAPVEQNKPEEVELRRQLLAELERVRQRRREALGLPEFLRRRLRKLGEIPQPWPECFYAGEILLGCLAGVAMMRFNHRPENAHGPSRLPGSPEPQLPV